MNAWPSAPRSAQRPAEAFVVLATAVLVLAWLIATTLGFAYARPKLATISSLACAAMLGGWALAELVPAARRWLVWADGLAAGAMVTSACLFLLPMAMTANPAVGGLGVAGGLLLGAAMDRVAGTGSGEPPTFDSALAAITLHAIGAGVVIGLIYARMPALGWLLGVAVVSHKLPAGYALARARRAAAVARYPILWPACAVGLCAVPVGFWVTPGSPANNAGLFGFATGVFLHVGQDFARPGFGARAAPRTDYPFVAALGVGVLAIVGLRHGVGA